MPDRPILTIAIPVFNGQKNLKLTLHSIFDGNELSNEFEVLVSDNASIDNTAAILNEYRDRYSSHLRINTNSTNIGYDQNIDILVQHANGIYVWFIGCGEAIASGSIFNILSHLRKEYFDTIVLNFDVYEEATKKYDKKLSYPDYEVQITADKNDFSFPRYCPAASFLTSKKAKI
jgi:glycosyltransferase involved in cell wall biosynthesis